MTNQIHPYEPLTSQNAALVLVDHQVGLMTGVRDYSTGELKHNVVALARDRGDRPQEADFRWHLARSLCGFPGDHSRG